MLPSFLIASLCINVLHDSDVSSIEELRQTLGVLVRTCKETGKQRTELLRNIYAKTMERINRQPGNLAKRVLLWVLCARRPMSCDELQDALACQPDRWNEEKSEWDASHISKDKILSACLGLITMDTGDVRLSHHTAYEFFASVREQEFPGADDEITKLCLAYLSAYRDRPYVPRPLLFGFGAPRHSPVSYWRCEFYRYAVFNWGDHARNSSTCQDLLDNFLKDPANVDVISKILDHSLHQLRSGPLSHPEERTTKLHWIAYFGLEQACLRLIRKNRFPFQREWKKMVNHAASSKKMTPLHYAVLEGHVSVAKLLLKHGASVNAVNRNLKTALDLAGDPDDTNTDLINLLEKHGGQGFESPKSKFRHNVEMAIMLYRLVRRIMWYMSEFRRLDAEREEEQRKTSRAGEVEQQD